MGHTQFKMLSAFLVGYFILVSAASVNAQSSTGNVQQTTVGATCASDPQCMTGMPDGTGASRLNAQDRILIQAQEVGSPTPALMCRAVLNNGTKDVFVPWKTPEEWSSFIASVNNNSPAVQGISMGQCCPPLNATVCGQPVYYAGTATAVPLGYRPLGVLATPAQIQSGNTTPPQNWGSETDILGPLSAPAPLDYQVTYVCSSGSWVKTREIGSCTPTNGSCSSIDNTYVQNFPSDPSTYTQALCGTGSIFDSSIGLQTTATGWSWTCDGTQGMQNAVCNAYKNPPVNGQCGPLNSYGNYAPPYYTVDQLNSIEATNPGLICSSGTFSGAFNNNGYTSRFSTWNCEGQNGGSNSPTCGAPSSVVNGTCGSDNGSSYTSTIGNPPPGSLCGKTGEIAQNLLFNGSGWTWTCSGLGTGIPSPQCSAAYNPTLTNGACGTDANGYFPDGTLSQSDPNLCRIGTPGPVYNSPGQTPAWGWLCLGASGGNYSWCTAYDQPKLDGQCGPATGTVTSSLSSIGSLALCTNGTATNFNGSKDNSPYYWTWTCQGNGGGASPTCGAYKDPSLIDATCGSSAGLTVPTAPTTGLCSYGNPSAVLESSNKSQWSWTCTSVDQSTVTTCTAAVTPQKLDGVCGAANNTAIPNTPNYNLCGVGDPSAISGTGPWTWSCSGTGGGGTSPQCMAYMCNACTGTTTRTQSATRSATIGSCSVTGVAAWTEIDQLIAGGASQTNISWTDVLGTFGQTVNPSAAPWPTYCPPCYLQAQGVQNAATTITSVSGHCGTLTPGQVITAGH